MKLAGDMQRSATPSGALIRSVSSAALIDDPDWRAGQVAAPIR